MSKGVNPFEVNRTAILVAASELYRANREGVQPDPVRSTVVPRITADIDSVHALRRLEQDTARVNIAARAVSRMAGLEDTAAEGGIIGGVARIEARLTRVMEWPYLRHLAVEGSLVDVLRGVAPIETAEIAPANPIA